MRRLTHPWLMFVAGLAPGAGNAADVVAGAPLERSVTVYRAPNEQSTEELDLMYLGGFALVTETRRVELPAGISRIRFEGVANDIEPQTALISGLPSTVIEKDEDTRVLTPTELIAASLGHDVVLVRTYPKTGHSTRTPGVIVSDAEGGVVFQSAEGVEALRCSGLPETFRFDPKIDLGATPTLSVQVQSPAAASATITLSYLAEGFDWAADYVATLSDDGRTMDLGAWVTLANSNDVSFPDASTQVVAGRLNRVEEEDDTVGRASQPERILARCWPQRNTSSPDQTINTQEPRPMAPMAMAAASQAELQETIVVTAQKRAELEQLGDLKLYRIPETTDVQSHQMKQVRLLDRSDVPVETYYRADLWAAYESEFLPAQHWIRSRNDVQHHLGLPLPRGRIQTFAPAQGTSLLIGEGTMRDTTLNEDVEYRIGDSNDVFVQSVTESNTVSAARPGRPPPKLRHVHRFESAKVDDIQRVEITNASSSAVAFELHVALASSEQLIRAAPAPAGTPAQPIFKLRVPAAGTVTIRYQTEHSELHVN
jgi:hypothetical protein